MKKIYYLKKEWTVKQCYFLSAIEAGKEAMRVKIEYDEHIVFMTQKNRIRLLLLAVMIASVMSATELYFNLGHDWFMPAFGIFMMVTVGLNWAIEMNLYTSKKVKEFESALDACFRDAEVETILKGQFKKLVPSPS